MFVGGVLSGGGLSGGGLSGGFCPGGFCPGGFCPGGFCPGGGFVQGVLSGGFCPGGFCPGGFCPQGVLVGGFCPGGFCLGGFCPRIVVHNFNYLGIKLDANMSWKSHIAMVSNKLSRINGILHRLKYLYPQNRNFISNYKANYYKQITLYKQLRS